MKKRRQIVGFAAAVLLAFTGSLAGYADPVTYDDTAEASYGGQTFNFQSGTPKVYPGDRIYGASAVYIGADNAASGNSEKFEKDENGTSVWTDSSAAVYQVTDVTPQTENVQPETELVPQTDENGNPVLDENGNQVTVSVAAGQDSGETSPAGNSYQLDPVGYVVEVAGGTSSGSSDNVDASASALNLTAADGSTSTVTPDARYYAEGSTVTVSADPAPDGQQFAGWSVFQIADDGSVQPAGDVGSLGLSGLSADSVQNDPLTFTMGRLSHVLVFAARYTAVQQDSDSSSADSAQAAEEEQTSSDTGTPADAQPADGDAQGETDPETAAEAGQEAEDSAAPAQTDAELPEQDGGQAVTVSVTFVSDDGSDSTIVTPYEDAFSQKINTASRNSQGQVFDHWESSDASAVFEDASSAQTTLTFLSAPAAEVTVRAVYSDVHQTDAVQTEAPQTDASQTEAPQTDAVQTEAPQADVPQTEAPQTDAVQTEAPQILSVLSVNLAGTDNHASVSLTDSANGEAIAPDSKVAEGTEVSAAVQGTDQASDVTVTAADGTQIPADVRADESKNQVNVTFTMPAEETSVNVAESQTLHTITLTKGSGTADRYTTITVTDVSGKVLGKIDGGESNDKGTVSNVAAGTVVTVKAENTSAEISVTSGTSGMTVTKKNDGTFSFMMPDSDVDLTVGAAEGKTFQVNVSVSGGTIAKGSGSGVSSGSFIAGTEISVTANAAPAGKIFSGWTVSGSAADGKQVSIPADLSAQTITVTVASPLTQSSDLTLTANYRDIMYNLTVASGSGTGQYTAAAPASIGADAAKEGYRFKSWTLVSGSGTFADQTAAETTFTCSSDAKVQAEYEAIPYKITVKNGKPSGTYTIGQTISLEPDFPAAGKEFDKWSVTSGRLGIDDNTSYYATAAVKASDATVTALYKNGPSPDSNGITGLQNDMEYLKSTTLTFQAVGAGMDNTDPNPGDYRYRPTGYQIGSVTGNWNQTPYQTSMAINAVGDYTLTVHYAREVYDGKTWNADGTTDDKSITIHVVNTLSVKTGDTSPILPLALAAAAALVLIIVLVVVRRRSHRR